MYYVNYDLMVPHKKAAAAAAAMTPNSAGSHCPASAVGMAAPSEPLVEVGALAAMTLLTMLNWSLTCCSLKDLAALGRAVYQSGLEKYVGVCRCRDAKSVYVSHACRAMTTNLVSHGDLGGDAVICGGSDEGVDFGAGGCEGGLIGLAE